MAELYVPENIAIGSLRWALEGDSQEMLCTIGLQSSRVTFDAEIMADDLYAAARATGSLVATAASLIEGWTFVGTTVRLMTATGFESGEHVETVVGTTVGNTLPNNTTALVKKTTGLGGRHYRGRMYLPLYAVDESDVGPTGTISSGEVTSLQTRCNNFMTALDTNELIPLLLHYPFQEQVDPPTDPPTYVVTDPEPDPTIVTALTVQSQAATQRRRMRR